MKLTYAQLEGRDPAKTKDEARNIQPMTGGALVIDLAFNDPKLSDEWFAVADTVTRADAVLKSPLSLPGDRSGDPGPWVDPDDAPEWTEETFDRAEHRIGDRVIKPATGTLTKDHLRRSDEAD